MFKVKQWLEAKKVRGNALFTPMTISEEQGIMSVKRIIDESVFNIGDKIHFQDYESFESINALAYWEIENAEYAQIVEFCDDNVNIICSLVSLPDPKIGRVTSISDKIPICYATLF